MKKISSFICTIALSSSLMAVSCVPALIIGVAVKSSKTKGQRQTFITEFQKTNATREEKGLKPLDWCSEAYKFDEGWANNDKKCAAKIAAYKKGDATDLDVDSSSNKQRTENKKTSNK